MASKESSPAAPKKTAAKAAAASKPAAPKKKVTPASEAAPARKRAPAKKAAPAASISAKERHHLVEVAAYYIAERRGFAAGRAHDDWLEAERQVDHMIAAGKFSG